MKKILISLLFIVIMYLSYMSIITINAHGKCRSIKLGDDISIANSLLGSAYGKMDEINHLEYLYNPTELYDFLYKSGVFIITDNNNKITRIDCE